MWPGRLYFSISSNLTAWPVPPLWRIDDGTGWPGISLKPWRPEEYVRKGARSDPVPEKGCLKLADPASLKPHRLRPGRDKEQRRIEENMSEEIKLKRIIFDAVLYLLAEYL